MFIYTIRRLNLFLITLLILTLIGYSILRLDSASLWSTQPFFSGWAVYLITLMSGHLGSEPPGRADRQRGGMAVFPGHPRA